KTYGERGHTWVFPDFPGITFSFSPFRLIFTGGLLYVAYIMFSYVIAIPVLSKIFILKASGIFFLKHFQHLV
ncbi:hypothetical protein ACQP3F_33295, partial [Escherichia coli]